MFWKILGAIVLVWIGVVVLGALLKALFPLVALAVVGTGLYFLFRAMSGDRDSAKSPF
ncbi:hypothetical protein [Rhodococcus sp. MEB041]|uniref:hypothetical protein n=1 Tax=Rhodococcus sp. MEB041 TaxID=3040323 RepID=UPI00254C1A49|nr:hypothetical protein [Rhodococcus sp. MEB041]